MVATGWWEECVLEVLLPHVYSICSKCDVQAPVSATLDFVSEDWMLPPLILALKHHG